MEEERILFREKTLEMLKKGIGQNEIARKLGISAQYISKLKKNLIKEGLITQKEIDEKKAELLKKNRERRKNNSNKKSRDEQKKETETRRNKVLQRFKEGKTRIEIMRELDIPSTTICRDEKQLIESGLLLPDEIVKQRYLDEIERERRNTRIRELLASGTMTIAEIAREVNISDTIVYYIATDKSQKSGKVKKKIKTKKEEPSSHNPEVFNNLQSIEKDVYNELRKGLPYLYIEKKLGITHKKCMKIVEVLSITGILSRKDIKEARNTLRAKDKLEILALLKQGYTQSSIIKLKKYLNVASCSRIITELKEEGKITEEEIYNIQAETNREYEILVLRGMQQGLTVNEIIALDKDGYLTESIVRRTKRKLIENGFISEKKFNNRNRKRQQTLLKARKKEADDEYINFFKKGLSFEEIARLRYIKPELVRANWYRIKVKYKISNENLEEWREKRRKKFENGMKALDRYIYQGSNIKSVQNFFEICIEENYFGRAFSEEEIEKLGRVILMDEAFLNKKKFKICYFSIY